MTPKQIESYHKSRERGVLRFVIIRGILMWGAPMALGFGLYHHFVKSNMMAWIIGLPIWTVTGVVFGIAVWHAERFIFDKHLSRQGD